MIERLAAAIGEKAERMEPSHRCGDGSWATFEPVLQDFYRQVAKHGLAAMREPTEAMKEAYTEGVCNSDPNEELPPQAYTLNSEGYRSMIDAAMAEG